MSRAGGSGTLTPEEKTSLDAANKPGLERLRAIFADRSGIAFLGAGVSSPLYPLWAGVISELVDRAAGRMSPAEVSTCRILASTNPDGVVELLRGALGPSAYIEMLRTFFRGRHDADGRSWTPTHELVVRCPFKGIVTTNFDSGIVEARSRCRPSATATGFASWGNDLILDDWRRGDIFSDDELPILFAHGFHSVPDEIVLASTEYRRAYRSGLGEVLRRLFDEGHLVWIGFSFADRWISSILNEVGIQSGGARAPGLSPRHVAVMPWEPQPANGTAALDPVTLARLSENTYGSNLVLYPVWGRDQSALHTILGQFTAPEYPPHVVPDSRARAAVRTPSPDVSGAPAPGTQHLRSVKACWSHGGTPPTSFVGRAEQLARLESWIRDADVSLIGVSAWAGAGKTALVTEWLTADNWAGERPAIQGLFGWSFYEDPSDEAWARALLVWARKEFGIQPAGARLADLVVSLLQRVPLVLVLDGLEILQAAPREEGYGRIESALVREVLVAMCRLKHEGLLVITSRFSLPDLERFDGGPLRMLDLPGLSPEDGAQILRQAGGSWLSDADRRQLSTSVDGHALALSVLAGLVRASVPVGDLYLLCEGLRGETGERVRAVLSFYAERISEPDRALLGIVSLFQRPVAIRTVLALGQGPAVSYILAKWQHDDVRAAVQKRLSGLLTLHPRDTVSAHPLVRDTFRSLVLTRESAQLASDLTLDTLPLGPVRGRDQAERVAEIIALLIDAGEWRAADEIYAARTNDGRVFTALPAAAIGQRCAQVFIATPERQAECRRALSNHECGYYLNEAGLHACGAGDMASAGRFLDLALTEIAADGGNSRRAPVLRNLAEFFMYLGRLVDARVAAAEAVQLAREPESVAYMAQVFVLLGETLRAARTFSEAERMVMEESGLPLTSVAGCWQSEFLIRVGRHSDAEVLIRANLARSVDNGWNATVARCERLLAICERVQEPATDSVEKLLGAAEIFRSGDLVVDLGEVLIDLADCYRQNCDFPRAEAACGEVLESAAERGLLPLQTRALAQRARVRVEAFVAGGSVMTLGRARDDAQAALRLSTTVARLPWGELDALRAQSHIDHVLEEDHGWAELAAEKSSVLMPPSGPAMG